MRVLIRVPWSCPLKMIALLPFLKYYIQPSISAWSLLNIHLTLLRVCAGRLVWCDDWLVTSMMLLPFRYERLSVSTARAIQTQRQVSSRADLSLAGMGCLRAVPSTKNITCTWHHGIVALWHALYCINHLNRNSALLLVHFFICLTL